MFDGPSKPTESIDTALSKAADVVIQNDDRSLTAIDATLMQGLDGFEVVDGEPIRFSVDVRSHVSALADECSCEVDVAEPFHVKAVVTKIHAEALME